MDNTKKFPKIYSKYSYKYTITNCPEYEGYIPDNLNHEVCGNCGNIHYYH